MVYKQSAYSSKNLGQKNEIMQLIEEAFKVSSDWCKKQFLNSITVKIECEPEILL